MSSYAFPLLDTGVSLDAKRLGQLFEAGREEAASRSILGRHEAIRALDEAFIQAGVANWDGEGSEPADALSYEYAKLFLQTLPNWVPNPEASVDPDGELCFEWDYGRRAVFSLSLARDGTLSFAGLFGVAKQHGVESFTGDVPATILENIQRAISNSIERPRR